MPASINILSLGLFVVSATALPRSPRPRIASLLAIGRAAIYLLYISPIGLRVHPWPPPRPRVAFTDLIWLLIGASLRWAIMASRTERAFNLILGMLIVVATLSAFL